MDNTTPPIPNSFAKNLFNIFPPVTFATVKKSDVGNVIIANSNPIVSIIIIVYFQMLVDFQFFGQ